VNHEVLSDIQQFLYREARLLDECNFRDWLSLLTEDIRYWAPVMGRRYRTSSKAIGILNVEHYRQNEFSGEGELALLDETKQSLERRVARLESGMAWAEEPPSSTCRFISNIVAQSSDHAGQVKVHSNFILYRTRSELEQTFYVGSREDLLRAEDDGSWRICYRKVLLPQNVLSAKNVSNFF
jgi:3-phenylpropionate/cinnamic acid dioxygenase small subunit